MPLEAGDGFISGLVVTNPVNATDQVAQGDDHLRLIKTALKGSFPGVSGAVTATHTELNALDGVTASVAELNIMDGVTLTAAQINNAALQAVNNTFTGTTQTISGVNAQLSVTNGTANVLVLTSGVTGIIGTVGAHPVDFYTSGVGRLVIDSAGDYNFRNGLVTTGNLSASEVGYKGTPQNAQAGDYTLVLTDCGKTIYKASGGAGETITIPANGSVAFPVGTIVRVVNNGGGTLSIAITTDTLTLAGAGTTGTRTLSDNGVAVLEKVASTEWFISGVGVS